MNNLDWTNLSQANMAAMFLCLYVFMSLCLLYLGYLIGHRKSKKMKVRVTYVTEMIELLTRCLGEGMAVSTLSQEKIAEIETAIIKIQILGTHEQIGLTRNFILTFRQDGISSIEDLLLSLRNELRQLTGLEPARAKILWLR